MQANAVEINKLTVSYGEFKALDMVDLTLAPNKIYGLLGRNGAGKTTLLNALSARIFPESGEARVLGAAVYENIEILKKICFIEEKGFYDSTLRVSQTFALAKGLYPNWDDAFARELIGLFELDTKKKYRQLSRGMETSMGIIVGLASRAPLTIFDEPSLGLDAVTRERFYDTVVEDFISHPRTIIISTHLIDEVSRIFEEIVIIDKGKILMQSEAQVLKERGFYISGKEEDVRAAIADSLVLHEERFGGTLSAAVYAKKPLRSQSVDIQPLPLQKLFVYLIESKNNEAFKKAVS